MDVTHSKLTLRICPAPAGNAPRSASRHAGEYRTRWWPLPNLGTLAVRVSLLGMQVDASQQAGSLLPQVYRPEDPGVPVAPQGLGWAPAMLAEVTGGNMKAKVWPWALLAGVGGAIAGALAGYMVGGVVCRLKKVTGL